MKLSLGLGGQMPADGCKIFSGICYLDYSQRPAHPILPYERNKFSMPMLKKLVGPMMGTGVQNLMTLFRISV
jgi:hypothetical protein